VTKKYFYNAYTFGQCYKIFYNGQNKLKCLSTAILFMRVPKSEALEICFTQVYCLTGKNWTMLKMFARDKRSSFLGLFVIYKGKMFYNIGPRSMRMLRNLSTWN